MATAFTEALRHRVLLAMAAALLGAVATAARASTPVALTVRGTLTIAGGGSTEYTEKYIDVLVEAGSEDRTINLPPAHDTLVIRGNKVFGDPCEQGSQCWDSDICAEGVCGWSGTEVAASCGDPQKLRTLDSNLDQCVRLWAASNPSGLVSGAKTCMEEVGNKLYGSGAVVSASCPQLADYQSAYARVFTGGPNGDRNVLTKAIRNGVSVSLAESLASSSREADRIAEIKGVLGVIDAWFRAEVARLGKAWDRSDSSLFTATSGIVGLFFKSVFFDDAITNRATPTSATDASQIADEIQRSGLAADKQVLRAAYGSEMPIQTAPLLLVTADALGGLAERTESFGEIQDVVCSVPTTGAGGRQCFPGATSVGNYMRVLGSLAREGAAIRTAVDAAASGSQPTSLDPWKQEFALVAQQHQALERAVLSAMDRTTGYDPSMLELDALDAVPPYAQPLASMIRRTASKSAAFEQTGVFRPRPREILFGLEATRNEKIRKSVADMCAPAPDGAIPKAVSNYRTNLQQHLTNALSVATAKDAEQKARVQLSALRERYNELAADLKGLRSAKQAEEMHFGDFMQRFQELAAAISDSGQAITVTPATKTADIGAPNARYAKGSTPRLITDIAVQQYDSRTSTVSDWKVARGIGDIVDFAFTGQWAPTCALHETLGADGIAIDVPTDQAGADILTGPEGYSATKSASRTTAYTESKAKGSETYISGRLTAEACTGAGGPVGPSVKACATLEIGGRLYEQKAQSETTGTQTGSTFSWGTGIRSPYVPFPQEPVGSLLLVELPHGVISLDSVRSVRVLTYPRSSILVGDASDFYLVVNDFSCPSVSSEQLHVQVTELVPAGAASRALAQAMAESVAVLRTQAQTYVDQGRLLAGQRELLRATALQRVYAAANVTSLAVFPESLRNLFETFVSKQIADIDREIEVIAIERQVKALLAEEEALLRDLDAAQTSGRVASVIGGLGVRNLDLRKLEAEGAQMIKLVRDWLVPVVNLRLSGDLAFENTEQAVLNKVIGLSPDGNYADAISDACDAVNELTKKLTTDAVANPEISVKSVILSIPNPKSTSARPAYREVDSGTASRVWESLLAVEDVDFTITPAMFYEKKEPYSLDCGSTAPVVKSMAYYLVLPALTEMNTLTSEVTILDPDMLFPRQHELFSYVFRERTFLRSQVEILGGANSATRAKFDNLLGNQGTYWAGATTLQTKGTSPFATYHIDLSAARGSYKPNGTISSAYPFLKGVTLLVAFQVETVSQATTVLPGVPPCDP